MPNHSWIKRIHRKICFSCWCRFSSCIMPHHPISLENQKQARLNKHKKCYVANSMYQFVFRKSLGGGGNKARKYAGQKEQIATRHPPPIWNCDGLFGKHGTVWTVHIFRANSPANVIKCRWTRWIPSGADTFRQTEMAVSFGIISFLFYVLCRKKSSNSLSIGTCAKSVWWTYKLKDADLFYD